MDLPVPFARQFSKEGFQPMAGNAAQDVQVRAQKALSASPVFALRELRVNHANNQLLISGLVASFYHKQLAQEVVRAVAEDVEVVNSINVREAARAMG
jgi:hypothetical protein